ncbi:MAG: LptF/LptG family permease [Candidatus Cloacimonetes bacterium]|nr:LptF/LptG family permease [Candidatus Cloacimonadota bacterium]
MGILKRYILKEHLAPFLISLAVVTLILLTDRIIDLLNTVIEKKLDPGTVINLFALSLPFMLALSIPMAVLVATILAFGRMTVDRETIAMKSSGINVYRMITPLLAVACALTGLMVYFNHWFLPESNHKLKNLMVKIAYYKPMTSIKAGEYTHLMDYTVFVKENNASELRDILIYDRSQTRFPQTLIAKSGRISQMDQGNSMEIMLNQGEMHVRDDKEPNKYQVRHFDSYVINLRNLGAAMDTYETGYRSDREMTFQQLKSDIHAKKEELAKARTESEGINQRLNALGNGTDIERRRYLVMKQISDDRVRELDIAVRSLLVEYHKKFALSFAIIIFVLIGIPLGLMTRSSGIGMAFSVSSLIFLIYYVALNSGEQFADKGYMSPFIAMWLSNFIFLGVAIVLIIASIYEKQIIDLHRLSWRLTHLKVRKSELPDEVLH